MTPRQLEIEEARKSQPLVMGVKGDRLVLLSAHEARQEEIRQARESAQ